MNDQLLSNAVKNCINIQNDILRKFCPDGQRQISRYLDVDCHQSQVLKKLSLIGKKGRNITSTDGQRMKKMLTDALDLADKKVAITKELKYIVSENMLKLKKNIEDNKLNDLKNFRKSSEKIVTKSKRNIKTTTKKKAQRKQRKRSEKRNSESSDDDGIQPNYCVCEDVSYGDMVCCDNDLCPIEWFHFDCVSLSKKPKGKWYCPKCRGTSSKTMKPREIFFKELEEYNKRKEEEVEGEEEVGEKEGEGEKEDGGEE